MTGIRVVQQNTMDHHHTSTDAKSVGSYRSTHTTRSSVLERAREYNRRLDQQKQVRSKSAERTQSEYAHSEVSAASEAPRSQSAGRMGSTADNNNAMQGNRVSTRERAMASVQRESLGAGAKKTGESRSHNNISSNNSYNSASHRAASPVTVDTTHSHRSAAQATPRSNGSASAYSSHVSRPKPTTPRMADYGPTNKSRRSSSAARHNTPHHLHSQSHTHSFESYGAERPDNQNNANNKNTNTSANNYEKPRDSPPRSMKSSPANNTNNITNNEENHHEAVVTPELLVDALSGHEDGLLAIAEKLMEHYDSGYDVMGEAIIDAFADVQKLFQHVVEAAHMEGAAFEASRREEEMTELRQQAAAAGASNGDAFGPNSPGQQENANAANGAPAAGPTRHDEFIDQDVKDILNEATRKGSNYRNNNKFTECYQLYEQASQNASSLLPVDSDHRGRLQLSIARAESMSHERACAILRYAMDDVLRSGLRAGSVPLPDPSKRADVVLNRPKGGHAAMTGSTGVQSSEEALNSLVEEMREVMNAPVYNNTPLQSVATRFLAALADAQKAQQKNEEKLEQNLAKLKGDFLLARAVSTFLTLSCLSSRCILRSFSFFACFHRFRNGRKSLILQWRQLKCTRKNTTNLKTRLRLMVAVAEVSKLAVGPDPPTSITPGQLSPHNSSVWVLHSTRMTLPMDTPFDHQHPELGLKFPLAVDLPTMPGTLLDPLRALEATCAPEESLPKRWLRIAMPRFERWPFDVILG